MFILLIGILIAYLIYFFTMPTKSNYFKSMKDIILLVTAHPDDECMFFAPTILSLLKEGYCVYLLCLSAGGFYGKSSERKKELRESCKILGIPSGNVIIIEHSKLPDHPDMLWSEVRVALIIKKYFIQLSAKIIFSFDEAGVSNHQNHVAICSGLKYLKAKGLLPKDTQVFLLKSVFLLEKYLACLSLPLCRMFSGLYFISTFKDIQKTWLSMKAHRSQFVWFRKLYIIFSRYVYINTFKELIVGENVQ